MQNAPVLCRAIPRPLLEGRCRVNHTSNILWDIGFRVIPKRLILARTFVIRCVYSHVTDCHSSAPRSVQLRQTLLTCASRASTYFTDSLMDSVGRGLFLARISSSSLKLRSSILHLQICAQLRTVLSCWRKSTPKYTGRRQSILYFSWCRLNLELASSPFSRSKRSCRGDSTTVLDSLIGNVTFHRS
jgi:hypothetical protein